MQFSMLNGSVITHALRIAGSGNVGVGTTNPPVRLTIAAPGGSGSPMLRFQESDAPNYGAELAIPVASESGADNGLWFFGLNNGNRTPSPTVPALDIAGLTGNVGIGTTNPAARLTIGCPGDQNSQMIRLHQFGYTNYGVEMAISPVDNGLWIWGLNAGNRTPLPSVPALDIAGISGNVGVHTTNPAAALDVGGTFRVSGTTTFNNVGYNWPTGGSGYLTFDGGSQLTWSPGPSPGTPSWVQTGAYLYPQNISSSVGIGTTTPAKKLHVYGNTPGGEVGLHVQNEANSGSSRANIQISVGGSSAGDPISLFHIPDASGGTTRSPHRHPFVRSISRSCAGPSKLSGLRTSKETSPTGR
jgi:hypothetical protein